MDQQNLFVFCFVSFFLEVIEIYIGYEVTQEKQLVGKDAFYA